MVKILSLTQFIYKIREEKESTLLVIACSGSKRRDYECDEIIQKLNFHVCKRGRISFSASYHVLNHVFRKCVGKYHATAVNRTSKSYPAFIRYYGYFYRAIEEKYGLALWNKVLDDEWNVLILSAYYGFLQIDDPIQYYNLRISELSKECLEILPKILNMYVRKNSEIQKIIFLTSQTYVNPFRNKINKPIYRLSLKDKFNRAIIGPYGRDFYYLAGEIFASIISKKDIHLADSSVLVGLEVQ